jgi:polyhydroxyalkanoate synthesis repressor PhaR
MAEPDTTTIPPVVIKKYANRRLYNTQSSAYVTLDRLCQMVKDNVEFVVYDAKTGEDITRQVLTQIIVEEEGKGQALLPIGFLRQLIGFYGDSLQTVVPRYLDQSMDVFSRNQDRMRGYMQEALGGMFPFGRFEEMGRNNLAFFERALKMFNPFLPPETDKNGEGPQAEVAVPSPTATPAEPAGKPVPGATLDTLKHQLDALQRQINSLSRREPEKPKGEKEG